MIRLKSLYFTLDVPLYNYSCLFVLGYDRSNAARIVQRLGGSDEMIEFVRTLKRCKGVTSEDGTTGKFLIYMEDLPVLAFQHGTLVHELFHLVEQVLDRVGMKHEIFVSSEAYAYLLGQITADALHKLWKSIYFQ